MKNILNTDISLAWVLLALVCVCAIVSQLQAPTKQPVIEGSHVVFVIENMSPTVEQEMVIRRAREAVSWWGYESLTILDDDQFAAKALVAKARASGLTVPFMAVVKDGSVLQVMAFPTLGDFDV